MFENVIGQGAAALLKDDIQSGRLPPSVLFYGPEAEGKLTVALELARALSCRLGTAEWGCQCPDCAMHRELTHPDLAIAGPRDCALEIRASAATFLASHAPSSHAPSSKQSAARFLFIRSIRKLTCRFSGALAEGDEGKGAKALPLVASIADMLEDFSSLGDSFDDLEKAVGGLVDAACKLEDDFLPDSVPISVIRNAASWTRLAPYGKKKILIVENADRMQDAARNAFLKILEEPPQDAMFILTTTRRGAIIPTVLSRVRTYAFVERAASERSEVVSRVFRSGLAEGETLSDFFNRYLPVSADRVRKAAVDYLSLVLEAASGRGARPFPSLESALRAAGAEGAVAGLAGDAGLRAEAAIGPRPTLQSIVASLNKCKPPKIWRLFISATLSLLSASIRQGRAGAGETSAYARWLDASREALFSVEIYNLSALEALERLFDRMCET